MLAASSAGVCPAPKASRHRRSKYRKGTWLPNDEDGKSDESADEVLLLLLLLLVVVVVVYQPNWLHV